MKRPLLCVFGAWVVVSCWAMLLHQVSYVRRRFLSLAHWSNLCQHKTACVLSVQCFNSATVHRGACVYPLMCLLCSTSFLSWATPIALQTGTEIEHQHHVPIGGVMNKCNAAWPASKEHLTTFWTSFHHCYVRPLTGHHERQHRGLS